MKRFLTVLLALMLVVVVFSGCNTSTETSIGTDNEPSGNVEPSNSTENTGVAMVGLGVHTSIEKSKDLKTEEDGTVTLPVGQVDSVLLAAAFDKDGKVTNVTIDQAQTKVEFDKELQVTSDTAAEYKTKVELADEYGMKARSEIDKEWYEQVAALGDWMVGKTVAEVKAMKTKARDESHPAVPDEPELASLVTINIGDFIAMLEKAYNNAIPVEGEVSEVGLGHSTSIAKSKGLSTDSEGNEVLPLAQVDTALVAAAFDNDGVVVGTIIDQAQTKIEFDKDGMVTTDKTGEFKTKVEKADEYGMMARSEIGKEWYQQVDELAKWMTGKTVEEVKAMKTKERDASHPAVPDEPELASLVTINVGDFIAGLEEASMNAK